MLKIRALAPPVSLAIGLSLLSILTACGGRSGAERPNVLFIFADDQRADTIYAWGNPVIDTPNIDRLVDGGFSFRSNYNMGGNSGAVCVPSRAMVNSGLAYFRIRHDLGGTVTMPEWLRQKGYLTFATGKWHNGEESWLRSFERGRSIFFGGMSDHTKVPLMDLSEEGDLINERVGDGFSSEMFADAAVDFLENYTDDRPFYAYVAFTAPHDPRQPPVEFREQYYANRPPLPGNFMPRHPFNLGEWLTVRDEVLAPFPRPPEMIRDQLAEYYGMVTHLDAQIGRILEALDRTGLRESTIIVYAADHGLALGSHGLLGKQSVYEHSQKCPLIFSGPGIPTGETAAFSYLLDIPATIASVTGSGTPGELDGKDLSQIWKGKVDQVRETLFLGFMDQMRSVRDQRYKLIVYPQLNFKQLFDLQEDPIELVNLAEEASLQERVTSMSRLMEQWQANLGDLQPLEVENPAPMEIDLSDIRREPDRWQPAWIVEKYFGGSAE